MTTDTALHYLSLHELAERIRSKDLSPVEATEATLARIESLEPELNAFITVTADRALADARAAADEIASGNCRGLLHGVPVAVKDLCETTGILTTAGSSFLEDWIPDEDATVMTKLREAGAIIVGKLNMHEWAFGATGLNPHYGAARNPWDTDRITGGSSSGSGAAVAAGMCYAALGSDTGGSIRIPSSLCGISGIKPTYGRVSLKGIVPLAWSLDHVGPMARTVRDCAIVLEAIAGYDPGDPRTTDRPVVAWSEALDHGVAGLRIGVPRGYIDQEVLPGVKPVFEGALQVLTSLGADVRTVELPVLQEYWTSASIVLLGEAAAFHKERLEAEPERFTDSVSSRFVNLKATDYIIAARQRDEARRVGDDVLLRDLDLLAMPSTLRTAVTIESVETDDPTLGLTRFTAMFDLTGQPAISVPCGLSQAGLPVGLQLVGKMFDEATVLRAAHAFQTESGIEMLHPPLEDA